MNPINIIKIIGIPDDNGAKVLYNDGFLKEFALFFDGNSSFLENISIQNCNITTLYLGGEKQFQKLKFTAQPHLVINMICDPEIQKKSLHTLERIDFAVPIINTPSAIRKTSRDSLSQNLTCKDGFYIPKTYRLIPQNKKELIQKAYELFDGKSFIIRPVFSHGGLGLEKIDSYGVNSFNGLTIDGKQEYFLSEFVDFADGRGLYQKARFFMINGIPYPRHFITSKNWKIHSNSRNEILDNPILNEEEALFLANPPQEFLDFCRHIWEYLGLDFFGIDCAKLPDGRIVLFEANVCMRPFAKHTQEHLKNAQQKLLQSFSNLLLDSAKR